RAGGRRAWVGAVINGVAWGVRAVQGLNSRDYRPPSLRLPYRDQQIRLVHNGATERLSFTLLSARDGIELIPEETDLDGDGVHDPPPPPDTPYDPNLLIDSRFVRLQVRWDHTVPGHPSSTWVTVGRDRQQNLVPGLGLIGASGIQYASLDAGWFSVGHDGLHTLSDTLDLGIGAEVTVQPGTLTALYQLPDPDATTTATKLWAGPYAELGWMPGRWRFAPGIRVSAHQLLGPLEVVPEPRGSIRYDLSDHVSLVGYSGLLSQGPTLERAATGFAAGELGVIRALQSTVGLSARWPSGFGLELAVYETELWDLVVRDTKLVVEPPIVTGTTEPYGPPVGSLQEVPVYRDVLGRAYGLEAQLRLMPDGDQFGWIAGAIGRSTRTYPDGTQLRSDADLPASLVVVWGTGLGKNWTISGRGQLTSGLVFDPLHGVQDEYGYFEAYEGDPNSERYPLYKRLDVRFDKTWIGRRARWTFYLDVYNALNSRNPLFPTYDYAYRELEVLAFVPILPTFGLEVAY
ncbi:MAG: TonB-dependent receptor, partial [Myxococcota bacterium]